MARRLIGAICSILLVWPAATELPAQTLDFDDLSPSEAQDNQLEIPDGYQGFSWNNVFVLDPTEDHLGTGYETVRQSAPNIAFNGFGADASIASSSAFDFVSGHFAAAWRDGLTLDVAAFRNGSQVFTEALTLDHDQTVFHTFDWTDVHRIEFASSGGTELSDPTFDGTHFGMDDLSLQANGEGEVEVPEPSSWLLLSFGLLGMAGMVLPRSPGASI